jgi:hypothetical protein
LYAWSKETKELAFKPSICEEVRLRGVRYISHLTVSYKINRKETTHEFALKMINVTGYKESGGYRVNYRTGEPENSAECGFDT